MAAGMSSSIPRLIGGACALALLCAAGSPAQAAVATAVARAKLIEPLSLVNTASLSFGNVASGQTAGTVVVSPAGARAVTGGVAALGGEIAAAQFLGAAAALNIVAIRVPQMPITLNRVGGGPQMRVRSFTLAGGNLRIFLGRQPFEFGVGGTLEVGASQADGTYEGSFEVTVDYF